MLTEIINVFLALGWGAFAMSKSASVVSTAKETHIKINWVKYILLCLLGLILVCITSYYLSNHLPIDIV